MVKPRKNNSKKSSVKVEDLAPSKNPKGGTNYAKIDMGGPLPPPKK